ncbi:SCO1664 family protein [Candidatus Lucifugimonas marina]|uniref:SCO1664 family protein n=1 Tax=Candidatus Lucifugimonas marina TaxID=3038979 RepID=A0AAJ6CVK4_9CHLR|nr:SCO1664 family protein [SAR202 cluster bacterium JH702]MDG0870285.1 SCO1664 family protein [SAR202 cluster bacterium JH639]WFG36154.1 SCO1664 family protein [SAR202 cluster bacterium JH545]WFG40100.1 SCO1664 family protein [SAR202 cluster bacterium JH1073]
MSHAEAGEILGRLANWPITGIGLHPGGSNYVFVVRLTDPEKYDATRAEDESYVVDESASIYGIYKPQAGERPLRDFPSGTLHNRERAAYLVSQKLGWPRIPPTVIRSGPHGEGSVQLFIDGAPIPEGEDEPENYFSLRDDRLDDFRDMAMFDVLVHNADRKGGSCILDEEGRLWAIDHGLTFNQMARRRTVMFEFNGSAYPEELLANVEALISDLEADSDLAKDLTQLLSVPEIGDLVTRGREMVALGHYPVLDPDINVPWPMV